MDGIGVGEIAGVNEVNEKPCALDVTQKANAEARAFVRALNQARQIGYNEGASDVVAFFSGAAAGGLRNAIGADDTKIWLKRSERIVGNFRARSGNHRNQRGLAGGGIPDKTHIRKQF